MAKQFRDDTRFRTTSSLIEELGDQDPQRWTTFVRLYGPMMRFWMHKEKVSKNDQEDILQEVLRSVAGSVQTFQRASDKGSFRGWLRTIVRRRVVDWRRAKKLQQNEDGKWVEPVVFNSKNVDQQRNKDHKRQLQAGSPDPDTDPEEQREVHNLKLRALELIRGEFETKTWEMFLAVTANDRSSKDVGKDFGVSSAAVRVAKSRVLSRLRQLIPEV